MSQNDEQQALVPRLRFPEFRDDAPWQKERLKRLFDERTDKGGEELPLLSLTDAEGLIHQKDSGRKDNSNADKSRYARVYPGDIAYNTMRMWEGRSALACEAGLVSPAYTVCIPKDSVDGRFFAYYFKTAQAISQFRRFSQGLVKDTLSLKFDRFAKIQLPTTSPAEQRKIADCLGSVDDLIAAEGQKLAALRDHKKGLMQQVFPREGETRPRLRFPEFQKRQPWKTRQVGDVFKVTRGQVLAMPLLQAQQSDETPYPVYSSRTKENGLSGYYREYLFEDAITWTTDGANAGDVNFRRGKFYCTNVCGVLISEEGFANECIAALLNNVARNHVSYVGNPKLMNGVMAKIVIPFPERDEQDRIADCLASLEALIFAQTEKLDALRTHKRGLMQQLFPSPEDAEA